MILKNVKLPAEIMKIVISYMFDPLKDVKRELLQRWKRCARIVHDEDDRASLNRQCAFFWCN